MIVLSKHQSTWETMIHIDRRCDAAASGQLLREGSIRLAQARRIVLFPEGIRTRAGARIRCRTDGPRLAVRTGVPVVPVAVNSGEFWPRRAFVPRPGTITVSIGEPIPGAGKTAEALSAEVESWTESEMQRISPHLYRGQAPVVGAAPAFRQ